MAASRMPLSKTPAKMHLGSGFGSISVETTTNWKLINQSSMSLGMHFEACLLFGGMDEWLTLTTQRPGRTLHYDMRLLNRVLAMTCIQLPARPVASPFGLASNAQLQSRPTPGLALPPQQRQSSDRRSAIRCYVDKTSLRPGLAVRRPPCACCTRRADGTSKLQAFVDDTT